MSFDILDPVAHARIRILLVEDNVDAADSTTILMQMWGHEVYVADDGKWALEIATAIKPNLALLDISLPVINGFAIASHLRMQPETKDTVIVAVTGHSNSEYYTKAKRFGFDFYIQKPTDFEFCRSLPKNRPLKETLSERLSKKPRCLL